MSKRTMLENEELQALVEEIEQEQDEDMASDDIGFIIDSDGNLKTIFGNIEAFTSPPDSVAQILEMLGVDIMDFIKQSVTLH